MILFLFPYYIYGQNVANFSEKQIISEFNVRPDNSINIRKSTQVFKDSVMISETYWRCVLKPNDPNAFKVLGDYDDYFNLAIEAWKDIPDTTGTFTNNQVLDSLEYIGDWRLNLSNKITNGKLDINNKGKFIFIANDASSPITRFPVIVKTNFVKFKIGDENYLLLKNGDYKYLDKDKLTRFIKLKWKQF